MNKIKFSYLFLILVLSSCFKTQSEIHFDEITKKGKNVWHVDKMRVVSINYSTNVVELDTTYLDVGNFTFEKGLKGETEGVLKFDGSVKLNPNASTIYGPFEMPFFTATSTISASSSKEFQVTDATMYDVTHLKKDKMNLFVSKNLNAFFSQFYDFTFYFECTRL